MRRFHGWEHCGLDALLQLGKLFSSFVGSGETESLMKQFDDWRKGRVCGVRKAAAFEPRVRLARQFLPQGERESRLADASLTGNAHDRACAFASAAPAIEQDR